MNFDNASSFFAKHGKSAELRLVLMTHCTDEDVVGFPRAMLVTLNKALVDQLTQAHKLFDRGGFKHLTADAAEYIQPLYLDNDIRPDDEGWSDPEDFTLHFSGISKPIHFTCTVTDEDEMVCDDALVSSTLTFAEIDSLFAETPAQTIIQLGKHIFAKIEDLESQIDKALADLSRSKS